MYVQHCDTPFFFFYFHLLNGRSQMPFVLKLLQPPSSRVADEMNHFLKVSYTLTEIYSIHYYSTKLEGRLFI